MNEEANWLPAKTVIDTATLARWRATLERVRAALEWYHGPDNPLPPGSQGSVPAGLEIRPLADADYFVTMEVPPDD